MNEVIHSEQSVTKIFLATGVSCAVIRAQRRDSQKAKDDVRAVSEWISERVKRLGG
jgi:hypothetical protein